MRFIVINRENIHKLRAYSASNRGVCGKTLDDVGFRKTISPELESKMSPAAEL